MSVLSVWWRACRHLHLRGYIYVWASICFVLTALPIVTAPAGFAGLVALSRAALRGERADLNIFWQAARENLGRGALLGVISLLVVTVNVSNLSAYAEPTVLSGAMRTIWLGAMLFWVALMFYCWPIYYAMERPSVKGALRNAALMILLNPVFTLLHLAGLALLAALSLAIPPFALLLAPAVAAIVSASAVRDRLAGADGKGDAAEPGAGQGAW